MVLIGAVLMGMSGTFSCNAETNNCLPASQCQDLGPLVELEHSADPSTERSIDGQDDRPGGLDGPDARPLAQLIDGGLQLAADANHDHVTITWSGSDPSFPGPIDGYRLTRNTSAGGSFTVDLGPEATSYNDTSVEPYTGYTYTLVTYSGGIAGDAVAIEVLTPDPYPPTLVIEHPWEGVTVKSSAVLVSWNGSDPYSGIASYWVRANDGEWISAGLEESFEVRGLPEGRSTIYVKAVAKAGNTAVAQINITVDAVPPSVSIISPVNGARTSSPVLSWEGFDSGTGASYEVILDGGASTVATSANEVRFDDLGQGRHVAQVRAADGLGNFAVAEVEFYFDTVSPTLTDRGPFGQEASADTTVWATFSEEMNTSSVSLFVSGVAGTGSWSGSTLTLFPAAPLQGGPTYTVTVSGTDLAGNAISESWSFTVTTAATLTGQVLDADGRPLEGAVVSLEDGQTAVTDRSGAFSIEAEGGRHDITVTKAGYLSTTSTIFLSPGQSMSLGAVSLAIDRSGDLYWATVDVVVAAALLTALLFICRRR